jgi:tetratricopeptide (TPR) repeat protein
MNLSKANTFSFRKELNNYLVSFSRGNEDEAVKDSKILYCAASLYYLSLLYEKKGMIYEALDALVESHEVFPESSAVMKRTAEKMALLNLKEESLDMYRKAIKILPFDIDLRIEYIKLLYIYKMDREAVDEINYISTITKKVHNFENDLPKINKTVSDLSRYNESCGYSHDSCSEMILNGFVETLYTHLKKNPNDKKLIGRIIEVFGELGRVDKMLSFSEDFAASHIDSGQLDREIVPFINDAYNNFKILSDREKDSVVGRVEKLRSAIGNISNPEDNMQYGVTSGSAVTQEGLK